MTATPERHLPLPAWSCLLLLLVLAVWLRWDTFPKTYFADELIPRAVVQHMRASGTLDTSWDHADWHGDYAGGFYNLKQYNFSSYHTVLWAFRQLVSESVPDLVLYRMLSLLFELLVLLLVFVIGRRFAGAWGGLLAAAFFAVMPQAVVDAHYARPEAFVMLLVALACWLALRAHLDRCLSCAMPEAFIWGVAFACKFSFFPLALLACAAQCYTHRKAWLLLLWPVFFVAGIAASAPYILLDPAGFLHGINLLLNQYRSQQTDTGLLAALLPSAHELFPYLFAFFGLPALAVLVLALATRSKAARCFAGVALVVTLFYLLLFAHQGVFFERNLSHLLPLWSVLFSLGFLVLLQKVKTEKLPVFSAFALLVCLGWPLYLSVRVADQYFRNLGRIKQEVAAYERALEGRFVGYAVESPSIMAGPGILDGLPENALLRIPQYKLAGLQVLNKALAERGYHQVDYLALPLDYLPYNQLQINHFPPAYAYYRRETGDGVQP